MVGIADLPFADLAVESDPARSRYKRFSDSLDLERVPEALWPELLDLYRTMLRQDGSRFRMAWPPDLRLRVQRRDTPYGQIFVARRIDAAIRPLDKVGLPPAVLQRLRDPQLRAGMVLFSGSPGAGKTTAACALLMDRLDRIGGFTWTAEAPVEYDLQGPHGKGQCYQEEIDEDADVKRVLMDTLRSGADTFYIGEIREEEAARAACLASSSGLLVASTIHADNPTQALMKLGILAGFPALAQSLRAVLSLRLEHRLTAANGPEKVLKVQPFFVEDEAMRLKVRDGNLSALIGDIDRQEKFFLMAGGMR
uniref:Putative PilU n=1 Tax=mine drainage metagenome TaxID=410659 RepID=E6QGR1_9ZZZZ